MEIDFDIEVTKAKIKLKRDKKAERIMCRSRVKWHEEGEKRGHPPFNPNSAFIPVTLVFNNYTSAKQRYAPHEWQ